MGPTCSAIIKVIHTMSVAFEDRKMHYLTPEKLIAGMNEKGTMMAR